LGRPDHSRRNMFPAGNSEASLNLKMDMTI